MNRHAKAEVLVKTGRVRLEKVSPDVVIADVDGFNGTYRVVAILVPPEQITCSCPALLPDCSHVRATYLQIQSELEASRG